MSKHYPVSLTPTVTERGLHVIKQWERERAIEYADGWTDGGRPIKSKGFGHSNLLTTVDFDAVTEWTPEYAHEVLLLDLQYFGSLLLPHLKVAVPDTIWSVCMGLSMNKGVGKLGNERGLINSKAWQILNDTSNEFHNEDFCMAILDYALIAPNKLTKVPEIKVGLQYRRVAEAGVHMQDRFMDYL